MSIFGNSTSQFANRRREAICLQPYSFFYASWPLLRMKSEDLFRSPIRVRYHWQQARFQWREQGRLKKPRKNFPKDFQKILSPSKRAYRWLSWSTPLH